MYVAVKGGEKAIKAAHHLQAQKRRGDTSINELSVAQIREQLSGSVDRVINEGGIYDKDLAALAIKQAAGDLVEAIFLLRAYRTTLSRVIVCQPIDTTQMRIERRISAAYKDIPGGQVLGSTYDYTHRLLDFSLLAEGETSQAQQDEIHCSQEQAPEAAPQVLSILEHADLMVTEVDSQKIPEDITMQPVNYPSDRSARLQNLVRGDEGFLLSLSYSTQRGYGRNHPFAGEIRSGEVTLSVCPEELGFNIEIGDIELTECQMINGFVGNKRMQQRLQIARNLVTHPKLIFMDEPTGGLDVSVQAKLLDLLRRLVNELDLAVVIVTHDLAVARLLAHRLMVMKQSKVVESGLTDQVLDDPQHPYTQLLVSSVLQG